MKLMAVRTGFVAVAAATLLTLPSLAHAAEGPVSPDTGPVRGGETVTVTGPQGVTFETLHTGGFHTMATGSDGNMYAWGFNSAGQLGTGDTVNRLSPAPVIAPEGVTFTDLEPGGFHTLALGDDGNVYAWGENDRGQLGTGDLANVPMPQQVRIPGDPRIVQISGGEYDSLALADDGTAYGWGYNRSGQTGTGAAETVVLSPQPVLAPDSVKFTSISAATHHSLALTADGAAYAWGSNGQGTLGDGTTTNSRVPVAVILPGGVTFTEVDAGGHHSLGLGNNGQAYAWGSSGYGQLGTGSTDPSLVPIPVSLPAGVRLTDIEANSFVDETEPAERESASAGGYHSLALGEDGTTWAWGGNQNGQIGNGTVENALTPVRVHAPDGVTFTSLELGSSIRRRSATTARPTRGATTSSVSWARATTSTRTSPRRFSPRRRSRKSRSTEPRAQTSWLRPRVPGPSSPPSTLPARSTSPCRGRSSALNSRPWCTPAATRTSNRRSPAPPTPRPRRGAR